VFPTPGEKSFKTLGMEGTFKKLGFNPSKTTSGWGNHPKFPVNVIGKELVGNDCGIMGQF